MSFKILGIDLRTLPKCIQILVQHLGWSLLQKKKLTAESRKIHPRGFTGSWTGLICTFSKLTTCTTIIKMKILQSAECLRTA